mgnify:CR=1 FL=1
MVKTNFCNVGCATGGEGPTWCPDSSMSLSLVWSVTVPNIKSVALLVSEIQSKQIFVMLVAPPVEVVLPDI